jgi:hypothetical protein
MGELEPQPETPWLFDPDFGLVLPEDRAGKEILVEEGIALSFPEGQVTGYRGQVTEAQVSGGTARVGRDGWRATGRAITNHQSQITNPTERLVFGRKPFVPERPRVAKTADLAQVILSGYGIYLGKKSERLQIKVAGKVAKGAE